MDDTTMDDTCDIRPCMWCSHSTIDGALSDFMQLTRSELEKKKDDEHLTVAEVVAVKLIEGALGSSDMKQLLIERTVDSVLSEELSRLMPLNRCAIPYLGTDETDERNSTIAEIIAVGIIREAMEEGGAAMRLLVEHAEGKNGGDAVRSRARTHTDAVYDLLSDKNVVDALLKVGFLRR